MKFFIFYINFKNKCIFLVLFYFSMLLNAQVGSPRELANEKAVEDIGDVVQLALPVAAGLTTLIINDKEGTWQFVKAFTVSLALTYTLKYVINKPRPEGANDGHAFPSGHTSVAFQSASFIQRRYGWKYGIPSYILSGFVAYSRLEGLNDRHDIWDIFGGIVVGVGSSYLFTTPYQKQHFELTFSSQDKALLVGVIYKF